MLRMQIVGFNLICGTKIRAARCLRPKQDDLNEDKKSLPPIRFGRSNFIERCEDSTAASCFSRTLSWESEVSAEMSSTAMLNHSHHTLGAMDQSPDSIAHSDDLLKSIFRKHFHQSVTQGVVLDRRNLIRDAMADCSGGGAFETSDPAWSIFCTKWIAVPFLLCQIVLIYNKFLSCLRLLIDDSKCTGRHFRFTPLELRGDSSAVIAEPGIGGFGLLRNGCGLRSAATHADGANLLADLGEQVGINGWWLTTRDHPAAHDPVRFTVDVSRNGQTWERCGASRFDAVFAHDQLAGIGWSVGAHRTSMQRNATEVFDMTLPWQFAGDHVLVFFTHAVAHTKVLIAVLRGNPMFIMSMLAYGYICSAGLYLISAVGYAYEGEFLACAVQTTYSALFSTFGIRAKRKGVILFPVYAAGMTAAGFVQYAAVFGGSRKLIDGYRAVVALDILTAFCTGAACLAIHILGRHLRYLSATSAKALVAADRRAYDAAWAKCLKVSDTAAALQKIETLVMGRWGHLRPELLRHQTSKADPPTPPIESLEQLFAQASVLLVFLRAKAKGWALLSQGRFPVLQLHGAGASSAGVVGEVVFERWVDIAKDPGMVQRVQWAKVKSTKRAAEKIYRCYAGEVARLVDCCRCQTIPAR